VPCASCGNPTNGAPPRPPAKSVNVAAIVIGVVAAALVVVAIIGILAAIAIPNFVTVMERSKQKRTMADMRLVGLALEKYGEHHLQEEYPPGPTVASLRPFLEPSYMTTLPKFDGWSNDYMYMPLPNRGYVIVSGGKDLTFDHQPDEYTPGIIPNFDCDIVYSNGTFVQYPGIQGH
jgi:type II secretory pathway pseudopilin PulG